MDVDRNAWLSERQRDNNVGCFPTDPAKSQQLLQRIGDAVVEAREQVIRNFKDRTCLDAIERHWIDEALNLLR